MTGTAFIIDHCRTPRGIGKKGKGALAELHPQRLGATVLQALKRRNGLETASVDDVIWGCSNQRGQQGSDLGRMTALDAGFDMRASGVTLDRFCGSGLTAAFLGSATVMAGLEDIVVAGGCEMMSHNSGAPDARRHPMMDSGNEHLRRLWPQVAQGVAADAVASIDGISRRATEELAVESQRRAALAIAEGRFDRSTTPVHSDDGAVLLDQEEYPRPGTTPEKLSELKPAFAEIADRPIDGDGRSFRDLVRSAYPELTIQHIHHAGTSAGVVDGAAALLLASSKACDANGWRPRARIVAAANMGDDPTLMLNAPAPAARKALKKAGLEIGDIDLFEVNEAFAVVPEKFIRDLRLDREKVNVNGGAIALGHPIGATGAILIGTLLDELERRDLQFGLATMCAAGGMAPAIIIERI